MQAKTRPTVHLVSPHSCVYMTPNNGTTSPIKKKSHVAPVKISNDTNNAVLDSVETWLT